MKRFKRVTALVCVASLLVFGGCGVEVSEPEEPEESGETVAEEITEIRAQDDFYGYVNLEALNNAEFRYGEKTAADAFDNEPVNDLVRGIIKEVAAGSGYEPGTEEYIIKTAYDKFNSYDFENAPVPAVIDSFLHEIDNVSSIDELMQIDARIGREFGAETYLHIGAGANYLESGKVVLTMFQYSGVMDADFESLEETYSPLDSLKTVGSAILQAMGHDKDYSDEVGKKFGLLALDLYNHTDMKIAQSSMPFEYFQVCSFDEMNSILSNVDLESYLKACGYDMKYCKEIGLFDLGQVQALNDMLTEENLDALKLWEMASIGMTYQRFIANGYDELAEYADVNYKSDEDQVVDEILTVYQAETDPLYVERYYSDELNAAVISMCDDIREGYRELITDATWLSAGTRAKLLTKLDNIVYVTAEDLKRHDPDEYKCVSGNDYFEFYMSYKLKAIDEMIDSLSKPLDRKEPQMPMQLINACYDPSLNNITITAAISSGTCFDLDWDYYTNLGNLGGTIAHEMGHAFDSNCIKFDPYGVYNPSWIAAEDVEILNARNAQAVDYFENDFTIFGVYHVDGEQTLGENYADLGGMECMVLLTSTDEQRKLMFESYAKSWCMKLAASSLLSQIENDEHSPNEIRVNAILGSIDEFYDTYDVRPGDGMYIAPEDRISRWH